MKQNIPKMKLYSVHIFAFLLFFTIVPVTFAGGKSDTTSQTGGLESWTAQSGFSINYQNHN
jgi:hypothetical protein